MSKPLDPVDEERTYVRAPTGEHLLIGLRQDLPQTLPTGERRYVRHTLLIPAANGTLINPNHPRLVACHCCGNFPLHEDATRQCTACEATVCLNCAARLPEPEDEPGQPAQYLCRPCARRARLHGLVTFFLSVR